MPTFKGELSLGDPEHYESAVCIQVERYSRTYVAKPPSASTFIIRGDDTTRLESGELPPTAVEVGSYMDEQFGEVRTARDYQVDDPEAPGGRIDVEREDLARGYEYGRTAVYITESDHNITRLETEAALEIIGFIPKGKVHMSKSNFSAMVY